MATQIVKTKKTAAKKTAVKHNDTANEIVSSKAVLPAEISEGDFKKVATADIDFSPLNHRKFYSQADLNDFAGELVLHGILHALILRKMPSGRYELVIGERRLRAAQIANLKEVPAFIRVLTDAEVIELQLAENLQRENPHPMNEAQGIGLMRQVYPSIEEIAARLGKKKSYVYSRIKLLDLIEPVQEMFFADVINIQEALDIAAISADSQTEFFIQNCAGWKEKENFTINGLRYVLSRFKYDLTKAPFDTKDEKLMPDMGACSNCSFNTATLKSLFPELSKEAVCTKKDCYQSKCNTHFIQLVTNAIATGSPEAIIYDWGLPEFLQSMLESIAGADVLPKLGRNEVNIIKAPVMPEKDDFNNTDVDNEDDFPDEDTNDRPDFDEISYNAAMYEYETDLEEYEGLLKSGELLKGLFVSASKAEVMLFSRDTTLDNFNSKVRVSAKEVQEAIKNRTATTEMVKNEIKRINQREQRHQELDREKVHANIHAKFGERVSLLDNNSEPTTADVATEHLLIYHTLNYQARLHIFEILGVAENEDLPATERLFQLLQNLTPQQKACLIRIALAGQSDSKSPKTVNGYFLYKTAEAAGVDVNELEAEQQEKANVRGDKLGLREKSLRKEIEKIERRRLVNIL